MVEKYLKYTYIGRTTPTALKNKVSKFRKIHYDKKTRDMVNPLVNEF